MKVDPLKFENLTASLRLVEFLCSDGMGISFRMKGVARVAMEKSIELADSCLAQHEKETDWNMHVRSVARLYREALKYRKDATLVTGSPVTNMKKSLKLAADIMESLKIDGILLN